MVQDLEHLANKFPNMKIIVGGDSNAFVDPKLFSQKFKVFPNHPQLPTTKKKRTWLQVQTNKSQQLSTEVKDVIITTMPFTDAKITTIYGKPASGFLFIPDTAHPCDHFVSNIII